MGLEMAQVVPQIQRMVLRMGERRTEWDSRLERSLALLGDPTRDISALREKIRRATLERHSTWLAAGVREPLHNRRTCPELPNSFTVVGADGSDIQAERHYSTRCFLINIASVLLEYGAHPDAVISSAARLYYEDSDVTISSSSTTQPPVFIDDQLFAARRAVEEVAWLSQAVQAGPASIPTVGLLDGSLVMWGLSEKVVPAFAIDAVVRHGFVAALSELGAIISERHLAVASYISYPRSTEVVNALRIAVCPAEHVDCDHCQPGETGSRPCDMLNGLLDRDLFARVLSSGERSGLFYSLSNIVREYYSGNDIFYFYVNLGDEIGRVELPWWVGRDGRLIDLVHAVVVDQCHRGFGYPVVLSEAHESAVITGADREQFWDMVERLAGERGVRLEQSAKSISKRTRYV